MEQVDLTGEAGRSDTKVHPQPSQKGVVAGQGILTGEAGKIMVHTQSSQKDVVVEPDIVPIQSPGQGVSDGSCSSNSHESGSLPGDDHDEDRLSKYSGGGTGDAPHVASHHAQSHAGESHASGQRQAQSTTGESRTGSQRQVQRTTGESRTGSQRQVQRTTGESRTGSQRQVQSIPGESRRDSQRQEGKDNSRREPTVRRAT